jgi:Fic family protein
VGYAPKFTITPAVLARVEKIAALRERILAATVEVAWIPALQKDTRTRNVHASTAIEGNPLSLEQVRALEEGRALTAPAPRPKREVINYFAGLRFVEKRARQPKIDHPDIHELHRLLAEAVMDQGEAGHYRTLRVRVGDYTPPLPDKVLGLMSELLAWWNVEAGSLSPVLSAAIVHYRFLDVHPFGDGNGRTARVLALWELYRRGFDMYHIFSVDEYYWEDRPRYYAALDQIRAEKEDLTQWLEYCAEALQQTLERVWLRVQTYARKRPKRVVLRPKQEKLLNLLRDHGSMAPREIWKALALSKQGTMDLIRPLLEAGLIVKRGTKKSGRYRLNSG